MSLWRLILCDWRANPRNPKAKFVLTLFRCAHSARGSGTRPRVVSLPIGIVYRLVVDWVMGIELPWKTSVGPGLRLDHGFGLVVNDAVVIGSNVVLRHGVTLGRRSEIDDCPRLEDGVDIGAGAIVMGRIVLGTDAVVGAGAVVMIDVPAGCSIVGNPGRLIAPATAAETPDS